jgi:hypothetical protein
MEIKQAMIVSGIIITHESNAMGLTDAEQRELISYLWKNKPEMVREIVCEECPEHICGV